MSSSETIVQDVTAAIGDIQIESETAYTPVSDAWTACACWLAECRPDIVGLLKNGQVREAMGIIFMEGTRRGELLAFEDPSRHMVLGEVDGRVGNSKPSPQLIASRKRRTDHRKASDVVTSEITRIMNAPPAEPFEIKKMRFCTRGELLKRMKAERILKKIAEAAIPHWWPKAKPGPKK